MLPSLRSFAGVSLRFARSMALLSAAELDDPDPIEALFRRGADLNALHPCGATAVGAAARAGSERALEALLACGALVDTRCADGDTALIKAARNGHLGCAELLLRHRAAVDPLCFERGWSALHWAGARKNVPLAMLLVGAGADPHARSAPPDDIPGRTPGEVAFAVRGDELFGRLLGELGASARRPKPR